MTGRRPYASRGVPHRPSTRPARPSRLPLVAAGGAIALLVACAGVALAFGFSRAGGVSAGRDAITADGPLMAAVKAPTAATGPATDPHDADVPGASRPRALTREWSGVARGTEPEAELARGLDADVAGVDGQIAVAVKDLATGRGVVLNGDREQPTASLYKLEVLYSVFDLGLNLSEPLTITEDALRYDTGSMELGPGESLTVAEALERMVVLSDNTSGVMLGSRVGGTRINYLMANMGLESTHYSVERMTSSATDMLALVESMARGRAASLSASADMIHLLLRQRVNDRLPRMLPADVQVAHKTGNLPGVVNDVGILYGPNQTIAVAAMISDTTDETAAATAIARLADTAYAYFASAPVDTRRPTIPAAPSRPIPPVWREPRPVATPTPRLVTPPVVTTASPPRDSASASLSSAPTVSALTVTLPPVSTSTPASAATDAHTPVPSAPAGRAAPTDTIVTTGPVATVTSAPVTRTAAAVSPTPTAPRATPTPARR